MYTGNELTPVEFEKVWPSSGSTGFRNRRWKLGTIQTEQRRSDVSDRKSRRGKGGKRERIEAWSRQITCEVRKAAWILCGWTHLDLDAAQTCLSIAVLEMVTKWKKQSGPPEHVEHWAPYLATSAYHVSLRGATKDAKLLEYRAPVADELNPFALDTPARQPSPEEAVIFKEDFGRALKCILDLSRSQKIVVVLWMIGFSYTSIARAMGKSESRVRTLKQKAIEALRSKMFQKSEDSGGRNARDIA
jgi:RNA polymerase sigma factor (sigma-70 family)